MKKFDIHIITCAKTAHRLQDLIANLQPLLKTKKVNTCRLILPHDIGDYREDVFDEALWDDQLQYILHILAANIRDARISNRLPAPSLLHIYTDCKTRFFNKRKLRDSEKSLLWKHYLSLSLVERSTLVIEDDANLDEACIPDLLNTISLLSTNNIYVDLGFLEGTSKRGDTFAISTDLLGCFQKTGMTRTTVAFAVNTNIAHKLVNNYWPCALPADLHHQHLLQGLEIPGVWPLRNIFKGMSTSGKYASSIQ